MSASSPRPGTIVVVVALGALFLTSCGSDGSPSVPTDTVAVFETFETTLDRAVVEANPFDPEEIAVGAEFVAPDGGKHRVIGFVARDFSRQLVSGREQLTPAGDLAWRVRFTPSEAGTWQWRWTIRDDGGDAVGDWRTLVVTPTGGKGFLRVSRSDARYLEFDDGSPYVAVGQNLAWYGARGTFDYDAWIERLAAEGATYIRLWMPSWAMGLEVIRRDGNGNVALSTLGDYTEQLDRAWQLDYVLDLAARHGIAVMLCIQNHGAFSLTNNSEWNDNPYNVANGGPLDAPGGIFTDAEARELFRRRLRYVVARWGHATNLLAWELWNEVDLTQIPSDAAVVEWHREMAAEIRALDPYDHLITTSLSDSLGSRPGLDAVWDLDDIDFTQAHYYSFGGFVTDFTQLFPRIAARLRRFDKPFLFAEAGVDFRGPVETLANDPESDGIHDILWAGLFTGGFGSGMTWWWDNVVDPEDLYFHFGAMAATVEGVDFASEEFAVETVTASSAEGRTVRVFVLHGTETMLLWVKNPAHQWYSPDPTVLTGVELALADATDGTYRARWIDTRGGGEIANGIVTANDGVLSVQAPSFQRDIALRLDRRNAE